MCAPNLLVTSLPCTCTTATVGTTTSGTSAPVALGRMIAVAVMFLVVRVVYPVARFAVITVASALFHLAIALAQIAVDAVRRRKALKRRDMLVQNARRRPVQAFILQTELPAAAESGVTLAELLDRRPAQTR